MFLAFTHVKKTIHKGTRRAAHFIFRVTLLEIEPWPPFKPPSSSPSSANSFIVRWQRGDRRSGVVQRSVSPFDCVGGKILLNHAFDLPVTLFYNALSSTFQEKFISFTLLDAEYPTGPPLARAILDLAAYAAASGVESDEATTTTAHIPITSSNSVNSNLQILITCSHCRRACFGGGKFTYKAGDLASYLPLQTVRNLLTKPIQSQPSTLKSGTDEAVVAALLKDEEAEEQVVAENGEEEEEEEEVEIESFTDDESLDGLRTPLDAKKNVSNTSSRVSIGQVAWTPNTKRPNSEEALPSSKTSSEFSTWSDGGFYTSSSGVSPDNQISSGNWPSSSRLKNTDKKTTYAGTIGDGKSLAPGDKGVMQTKVYCLASQATTISHQHDAAESSDGKSGIKLLIGVPIQPGNNTIAGTSDQQDASNTKSYQQSIIGRENGVCRQNFDYFDLGMVEDDELVPMGEEMSVLEEARRKFAAGAEQRNEKIEKRLLEETRVKLAETEVQLSTASEEVKHLQSYVSKLEGELQDAAAIETILYCTVVEHGGSHQAVLMSAFYLAKLHNHAITNWDSQRRASLMRSTVSGLIVAIKACGHNVSRLTFWWSNILALRHTLMPPDTITQLPSGSELTQGPSSITWHGTKEASLVDPRQPLSSGVALTSIGTEACELTDAATFMAALETVEAWTYARVVESTWSQAFAAEAHQSVLPAPQQDAGANSDMKKDAPNDSSLVLDLEEGMQQNTSIDVWKKAFEDALHRLCPVRVEGGECGCIAGLSRLVIEECSARLDVLVFNAILPPLGIEDSSSPTPDNRLESPHLPIPPGRLTFGAGVQLKNVVGTWATWLTILLERLINSGMSSVVVDDSRGFITFPLLKAAADLLMLPRDMVADKSVRNEVCPALSLPAIRRILANVEPDDFAPDPVTPSLLAALNAEIEMEKWMSDGKGGNDEHGFSADGVALQPRVTYRPHDTLFKGLVEAALSKPISEWAMQKGSMEDVLADLKRPLVDYHHACNEVVSGTPFDFDTSVDSRNQTPCTLELLHHRFELLQELWAPKRTS